MARFYVTRYAVVTGADDGTILSSELVHVSLIDSRDEADAVANNMRHLGAVVAVTDEHFGDPRTWHTA